MSASDCGTEAVALDDFPKSCTSFLYEGLILNMKHEVTPNPTDPQLGNYVVISIIWEWCILLNVSCMLLQKLNGIQV